VRRLGRATHEPRHFKEVPLRAFISGNFLAAICLSFQVVAAQSATKLPASGTYEVRVCSTSCLPDVSQGRAIGEVVILDDYFSLDILSQRARNYLANAEPYLMASLEGEPPNGCFSLRRPAENRSTFLGLAPVGVFRSRISGDTISVLLWASPDAGYVARLVQVGDSLVGHGYRWAPDAEYDMSGESLSLRRIGPGVVDQCAASIDRAMSRPLSSRAAVSSPPASRQP
jgi:hypothetical protein